MTKSLACTVPRRCLLPRRGALPLVIAFGAAALAMPPRTVEAQWATTYEQFYLPGSFNWTFRRTYPGADRLFNAFDYGHAILYERLYTRPGADPSLLEQNEYDFITTKLLVSPPRLPLEERAIEVEYAKIAPEAKAMFDWAHLLHRQVYDVLASESMSQDQKDATIARLLAYYKSRPDLAFSSRPKNMELMEGQPYSLAFRRRYPKFNGLIWGYHWLQVGLYEPLMIGRTQAERQAGVAAAVTRFRQMLENAPEHMPRVMPMTAAIAPTFAKRYEEIAIIFDNLHAMHDVISDILTSERVPRAGKRSAIVDAARRYRDSSSYLMSIAEWATMGPMIGIANMGGPAVGLLGPWPTPTVERGASMLEAMKHMPEMHTMPGMSPDSSHAAMGTDSSHAATGNDSSHAAMGHAPGAMAAPGQGTHDMNGMRMPDSAMKHAPAAARTPSKARPAVRKSPASKAATSQSKAAKKPSARSRAKGTAKPAAKPKPATKPKPADDMSNMPGMHH